MKISQQELRAQKTLQEFVQVCNEELTRKLAAGATVEPGPFSVKLVRKLPWVDGPRRNQARDASPGASAPKRKQGRARTKRSAA